MSTSLILTYSTSHDSYYMSIPYLACYFLNWRNLIVLCTFQPKEKEQQAFTTYQASNFNRSNMYDWCFNDNDAINAIGMPVL